MKYTVKMMDVDNYNAFMCGDTRCVVKFHEVEVEAVNETMARVEAEKMFPKEHFYGIKSKYERTAKNWWDDLR